MEHVSIIPFSITGSIDILLAEEEELDRDQICFDKAVLYAKQNDDDSEENIDINVQIGALGVFVYNFTLKDSYLETLYTNLQDKVAFTLKELRLALRSLLLSLDGPNLFNAACMFESELVILPNYKTYYNLHLNEKFENTAGNSQMFSFSKRVCTIKITDVDKLVDSKGNELSLELRTEDYLYMLGEISERRKYELANSRLDTSRLTQENEKLKQEIKNLISNYEAKIDEVEEMAVVLVNSKKKKIQQLIDDGVGKLDADTLHSSVLASVEDESDVEADLDQEAEPIMKSSSPRKRRRFDDVKIERRKGSQYNDFRSSQLSENSQQIKKELTPLLGEGQLSPMKLSQIKFKDKFVPESSESVKFKYAGRSNQVREALFSGGVGRMSTEEEREIPVDCQATVDVPASLGDEGSNATDVSDSDGSPNQPSLTLEGHPPSSQAPENDDETDVSD